MSISFGTAVTAGGAGIGAVLGFSAGGDMKQRAVTGVIGAIAGGLVGYGITLIPGLINQGLNQQVANSVNSATNGQASNPTSPTIQTIAANGIGATDYLDVPTVAIQGTGPTILAGSTNPQAQLNMNITNSSGLSLYSQSGVGLITVNIDSTGIAPGTYNVNMIDSTSGVAKTATLNYVPPNSDSIANIASEIEQGAMNLFSDVTGGLSGLI